MSSSSSSSSSSDEESSHEVAPPKTPTRLSSSKPEVAHIHKPPQEARKDNCKCRICVDNQPIIAEQTLVVKAKIRVTTTSCLEDLFVREDCDCRVSTCECGPLELVFLVDTSDSFNSKVKKDNLQKSAFHTTMAWVQDFLRSEVKYSDKPLVATILAYSGHASETSTYVAGSSGIAGTNSLGHEVYHYKQILEPIDLAKLNRSERFEVLRGLTSEVFIENEGIHKNVHHIDGNDQLFLALQDLSLDRPDHEDFIRSLDLARGPRPTNLSVGQWKPKRALVIVTDEDWDLGQLHDENGHVTTSKRVAELARSKYDEIFTVVARTDNDKAYNDEFIKGELSKPSGNTIPIFPDQFFGGLLEAQNKIKNDLGI